MRELDGGKAPEMGIVPAAGFSFDGNLVAMTGFEKKERSVLIFDTEKGRKVNSFKINDDEAERRSDNSLRKRRTRAC